MDASLLMFNRTVKTHFLLTSKICGFVAVFLLLLAGNACAQQQTSWHVANKYAGVTVDGLYGQILHIIKYNPAMPNDTVDLLCTSSATSHTNFVFGNGNGDTVYITNNNDNIFYVYNRTPKIPAQINPTKADSVYIDGDTIIADWRLKSEGYDIKQYTYPFLTNSSGSIAIEYRAEQTDVTTTNYLIGILLEFDTDIQSGIAASCNNVNVGGDNAPVLDSRQYEASVNGNCFVPVSNKYIGADSMPQWYQIANNFDAPPASGPIILGNMQNPSVVSPGSGPVLTPPDEWYIGTWALDQDAGIGLKNVSWIVGPPDFQLGATIGDVALVYKWKVNSNPFRCCMTFGPNDGVNENFNCYNANFWLNLRYPIETIKNPAGVKAIPIDTIQLWTTNVNEGGGTQQNVLATLDTAGTCFVLLPGESNIQKVIAQNQNTNTLGPSETGYCQWLVRTDTSRCCQLGDTSWIEDTINVSVTSTQEPIPFFTPCQPTIAVYCYKCFVDVLPPLITDGVRNGTTFTWTVQDGRHCDLGIDSINILDSTNFSVSITPYPFPHCDTNAITITGTIIDTTQKGQLTIQLIDCNNNADTINLPYAAVFDKLPPVIASTNQTNLATGSSFACSPNFECTTVKVIDNPMPPVSGVAKITILQSPNFVTNVLSHTGANAADTVTACVIDTFYNAQLVFNATDLSGNVMPNDTVTYCTLQDTLPPVITGGLNGLTYSYSITEKRPWDRGLLDVTVTSFTNVSVTGPTFYGDTLATISFTIVDTALSANFCFTARDSFFVDSTDVSQFGGTDANHIATQCGTYTSGVDTEPPNLSVMTNPLNPAQAIIIANDIHYINGVLYANDKNLNQLYFQSATDMDTTSSRPTISACTTKQLSWTINVLDTLSLTDSAACFIVAVTDCQPNLTVDTQWCYQILPDLVPPLFAFTHNGVTRDTMHFTAIDSGAYSRGLDSVYLTNLINVDPLNIGVNGSRGVDSLPFTVHITDTTKPASACINVMDLWTATHPVVQAAQITQGCFSTYVTPVWLDTLSVVENGYQFAVPLHISIANDTEQITSVDLKIQFTDGIIAFDGASGANGSITAAAPTDLGTSNGIHSFVLHFTSSPQLPMGPQIVGYLNFTAGQLKDIGAANVWIIPGSVIYNDYRTAPYYASPSVVLPNLAPFSSILTGDSVLVSGQCQQILLQQSGTPLDLGQNIPNPFSNSTTINYTLDRAGIMSLTLYSSLGIPVATLVSGEEKPGSYQVSYNASQLKPGVYYYCLTAGNAMIAKTMLIIR